MSAYALHGIQGLHGLPITVINEQVNRNVRKSESEIRGALIGRDCSRRL